MKAAVCRRYGPPSVVEIAEVPRPSVGANDVLIKVRATTVTAADWRLRSATLPRGFGLLVRLGVGFSGPRAPILGSEIAGEVVAVGRSVSRFAPGDKVFAARMGSCHAEYVAVRDKAVAPMPANLSFGEAAALTFGGLTALIFLRDKARIQPGERVFTKGRERYDIIFDAVGNCPFDRCKPVLAPGGRLLLVVGTLGQMIGAMVWPSRAGRKVLSGVASVRTADLLLLRTLAESGAFKPVIDRTYPFARIADGHARVDTGRKRGNVVIAVA